MKIRKIRVISNLIIVFMLLILVTYIGTSTYSYVFNYQNKDVIYNGKRDTNKISMMFNVYWGTEYIDELLKILDRYKIKTTFFVGGTWVEKEQDMLIKIYNKGHEIANHGFFHKNHENLSYDQNFEEINVNHKLVKSILNIDMNLFSPPSGSFNKGTIEALSNLGYKIIMWSKDTIDWRDKDENIIYERATKNIKGGDFVLMHPTECTINALPLILEYYKMNNIIATTVSDCLN